MLAFFLKTLRPYQWPLAVVLFSETALGFLGMLIPLFSVIIFDYAYPSRDLIVFSILIIFGFVFYLVEFFLNAHIDFLNIHVAEKINYTLALKAFEKIECLPIKTLAKTPTGDLAIRLTDDIPVLTAHMVQFFPRIALQLIRLGFFFYVSFRFDPWITVMAFAAIPLYLVETRFFAGKLAEVKREEQENEGTVLEGIQSRLLNIRTIKAFNQERSEAEKLAIPLRKNFLLSLKESCIAILNVLSRSFTTRLWGTFLIWFLGYEVIQGRLTIGQVVALGVYIPQLEAPIHNLAALYHDHKIARVSLTRLRAVLGKRSEETPATLEEKIPLAVSRGAVAFQNIRFAYDGAPPVLNNFNLEAEPGSFTAIVGESGAGKSTLLNLLVGLLRPQRGKILIDGQNIARVPLDSLRGALGVVFQETSILEGSVLENIAYGSPSRSENSVTEAAARACAHEFITALPRGYETRLSGGGPTLSAGQRQRLALARAFHKNSKILLLDEAASAVDAESAFLIQEALHRCRGEKTLLVVAHHLPMIKKADRILVLKGGKIAEEGTYSRLMKAKGLFFRLHNLQFGGFQRFFELLEIEMQRCHRYHQDLALVVGRIPNWEKLEARHDPNTLARLMEETNIAVGKALRVMDFSSVTRGNRIAIALPETDAQGAAQCIRRLEKALEKNGVLPMHFAAVSVRETGARYAEELFERLV